MINKKSLFILSASMLLGLASCGGTSSQGGSSNKGSSQGGTGTSQGGAGGSSQQGAETPSWIADKEADGKMFLCFKLGTTKLETMDGEPVTTFADYLSFYVAGSFEGWKIAKDSVELAAVEGHDGYYGTSLDWTYDPIKYAGTEDPAAYQITLGYNSKAGVSDTMFGIDWNYKSVQCAAFPGLTNPTYTVAASGKSIYFGEQTWSATKPAPVKIENYTVNFVITDVPTYVDLYTTGGFNGWADGNKDGVFSIDNLAGQKLTKVEGKTDVYSFNFGTVIKGAAVSYKIVAITTKSTGFWGNEGAYSGDVSTGNPVFTPIAADDYASAEDYVTQWSFGSEGHEWPADPAAVTFDVNIVVTVSDYSTTDTTYDALSIKGSFDGWAALHAMTADAAVAGKFSYTINVAAASYEFGLATTLAGAQVTWFSLADEGGNVKFTVAEAATFEYTGSIAAGVTLVA